MTHSTQPHLTHRATPTVPSIITQSTVKHRKLLHLCPYLCDKTDKRIEIVGIGFHGFYRVRKIKKSNTRQEFKKKMFHIYDTLSFYKVKQRPSHAPGIVMADCMSGWVDNALTQTPVPLSSGKPNRKSSIR